MGWARAGARGGLSYHLPRRPFLPSPRGRLLPPLPWVFTRVLLEQQRRARPAGDLSVFAQAHGRVRGPSGSRAQVPPTPAGTFLAALTATVLQLRPPSHGGLRI